MEGLVWLPEWLRPRESFWSVLFKVAFASAVDPKALAQDWLGDNALLRMAGTLPSEAAAYATCDRMGLPRSRAAEMFCGFADGSLEQRQRFDMYLRWCPVCAKSWFHSPLFQEWRRFRCPWHGVPLLAMCPKCDREFDVLHRTSWRCRCGETVASEKGDWPRLFRAPVPDVELEGEAGYLHTRPVVRNDGTLEFRLLQPSERGAGRPWYEVPWYEGRYPLRAMAFEEMSALLEFVLGRHAECVYDEPSQMWTYQQAKLYKYNCPVAAAGKFVAATTGCRARHFTYFDRRGRKTDPFIDRIVMGITDKEPAWLYRVLVRDVVMGLLHSALRYYQHSFKECDRRYGFWQDPGYVTGDIAHEGPDVAVLKPHVTTASLLELVNEMDSACPWADFTPRSKQPF